MKEKMETFFFIPLMGLQTCIVPVLSFNYATKSYGRCRETMKDSYLFSCGFMLIGGGCFVFFPKWKSQSVPVCDAPDILSDPDFLGAVSPGTSVYLVCVSDLRGACWSDRDGSVLEDDQWMEE